MNKNFPDNTERSRMERRQANKESKKEKVPLKKIAKTASLRKKPLGRRIKELFIDDETKTIPEFLVHDIFVPAMKEMFYAMITGGSSMALFGENRGRSAYRSRYSNGSVVDYAGMSRTDRRRPTVTNSMRARHAFDEVVIEDRAEAELILATLDNQIAEYGQATVADLKALIDIPPDMVDERWGWTDLRDVAIVGIRGGHDGWFLDLPRPIDVR